MLFTDSSVATGGDDLLLDRDHRPDGRVGRCSTQANDCGTECSGHGGLIECVRSVHCEITHEICSGGT
jgi:hypothetical protein